MHNFRALLDRPDEIGARLAGNLGDVADHYTQEERFGCELSDQALEAAASGHKIVPTAFFVTYCFGCNV